MPIGMAMLGHVQIPLMKRNSICKQNPKGATIRFEKNTNFKLREKVQIANERVFEEHDLSLIGSKHPRVLGLVDGILGMKKLKQSTLDKSEKKLLRAFNTI